MVNCVSDLQVLKSQAGYYVGTLYYDESGSPEPNSRDSDYFKTSEEAEAELEKMKRVLLPSWFH